MRKINRDARSVVPEAACHIVRAAEVADFAAESCIEAAIDDGPRGGIDLVHILMRGARVMHRQLPFGGGAPSFWVCERFKMGIVASEWLFGRESFRNFRVFLFDQ